MLFFTFYFIFYAFLRFYLQSRADRVDRARGRTAGLYVPSKDPRPTVFHLQAGGASIMVIGFLTRKGLILEIAEADMGAHTTRWLEEMLADLGDNKPRTGIWGHEGFLPDIFSKNPAHVDCRNIDAKLRAELGVNEPVTIAPRAAPVSNGPVGDAFSALTMKRPRAQ